MGTMSSTEPETHERILAEACRLMEERRGQGVRISDIARAAGVSRQAVYLHFGSRAELLVAAVRYADQTRGLDERLRRVRAATGGLEALEAFIEFWGNYIPEIYGLAKALLEVRETDEAAEAAWNDRMADVRFSCRCAIECLERDGLLAPEWSVDEAVDLLWSLTSIRVWEHLTLECGWSKSDFVTGMQTAMKRTFVRSN
jgi:AcrR family transcriptional regulator